MSSTIRQFDIWIADLNPQTGTEPGKTRPVLVIQTDLLNEVSHPSTIICPITTNLKDEAKVLRVRIPKGVANMKETSEIMIDQLRAIDNARLIKKTGSLPDDLAEVTRKNLAIVLDL